MHNHALNVPLALQAVHDQYSTSTGIKLTEWIAISTAVMALFTFVMPHLHHLRLFSGIAVALIFVFVGIAVGISIKDGAPLQRGKHSHRTRVNICFSMFFISAEFTCWAGGFTPRQHRNRYGAFLSSSCRVISSNGPEFHACSLSLPAGCYIIAYFKHEAYSRVQLSASHG